MVGIVACESSYAQFWPSGKPKISPTHDVGIYQLNIPTWGKKARKLGLDIFNSAKDNTTMARIVYKEQGLSAWTCSKPASSG